jgi:LmbE family N-acetylglucosaminyl deacetylase
VPATRLVLAPGTLGGLHADHALVRRYAVALAQRGTPVELYADLPYCARHGWPAWVTGEAVAHVDVDAYWEPSLAGLPLAGAPRAVRLSPEDAQEKLAAMRCYRTQLPALDGPTGEVSAPEVHRFEVFWPLGP